MKQTFRQLYHEGREGSSAEPPFFLQMCVLIGNVTQFYKVFGVAQLLLGTQRSKVSGELGPVVNDLFFFLVNSFIIITPLLKKAAYVHVYTAIIISVHYDKTEARTGIYEAETARIQKKRTGM